MIKGETLGRAIEFAVRCHKGQTRKGDGSPYITHPMRVMGAVMQVKRKSKNLFLLGTATILHDVVEDCGISLDEIASEFGFHVAALVEELTLDKSKYGENDRNKTGYLSSRMLEMSSYALTIKLADRLDNIRDMSTMPAEFKTRYANETRDILDNLTLLRKLTNTQNRLVDLIAGELEHFFSLNVN